MHDLFSFWGVNSTQMITTTSLTNSSFSYRNYLMGFNSLNLDNSLTQTTDILLQLYITAQTIWATSAITLNFVNSTTTYSYVWADVFHQRKRTCNAPTIYFFYDTLLCYDVCPARTYGVTSGTNSYCLKCHYSCLTCNGVTNNNCQSC